MKNKNLPGYKTPKVNAYTDRKASMNRDWLNWWHSQTLFLYALNRECLSVYNLIKCIELGRIK